MTDDRAQSEVVGEILLVAIAVLAASLVGFAVVGGIGGDERTYADVAASATVGTDGATITHQGGESIRTADLRVLVGANGSAPTDRPRDDPASTGIGDGRFDPGDVWAYDLNRTIREGTTLRVVVADAATETVVVDQTIEPGRPG